jgi:hypothetical protein
MSYLGSFFLAIPLASIAVLVYATLRISVFCRTVLVMVLPLILITLGCRVCILDI